MRRRDTIVVAVVIAIIAGYFLLQQRTKKIEAPSMYVSTPKIQPPADQPYPARQSNELGDILTDSHDPVFLNQVFPTVRGFFASLDHLGLNPLQDVLEPTSCNKVRIMQIPDGIICLFVIGDGWAAECTQNKSFSGITYFGQRGADDPIRAISHANTNALSRLSQSAVTMPEPEVWKIAERVVDEFKIDRSKFEKPQMYEEGLFDYHLGIYTVDYRKKGSDPVNGLNYTRGFSLKATSPNTSVLVSYHHYEATLR